MKDDTSAPLEVQEGVAVTLPDCQDTIQTVDYWQEPVSNTSRGKTFGWEYIGKLY